MAVETGWKSRWSLVLVGAALATSLYALAPRPALAHDDGEEDIFSTLLSTVGLGPEKSADPEIDYRERAPLVIPPSMDLPAPQISGATANPAWPKDPDVARRAKALALARQVRPDPAQPQLAPPLTQAQMAASHDPRTGALIEPDPMCNNQLSGCSPQQLWGMLSKKSTDKEQAAMAPGVDQPRLYLTDPPPGYRIATKVVKATAAAPAKADTAGDPGAYYREQALRDQSRDGLDR